MRLLAIAVAALLAVCVVLVLTRRKEEPVRLQPDLLRALVGPRVLP